MTPKEVMDLAKKNKAVMVDLKFMDFPGLWQHFSVPIKELTEDIFENGLGFDGSSIRGWQAIHMSDMLVIPDPTTSIMDPFTKHPTISLICNVVDPITKEQYSRDPRFVAQKAEAYMKSTKVANTIIRAIIKYLHGNIGFAVIGFGGFGARELNIGSDLDLIFVTKQGRSKPLHEISSEKGDIAEKLIRFLSEYTENGIAYKVDMRLRPDGSKGILVNNMNGYKNYYLKSAHLWEIQSLLRARPVAGDINLLTAFQQMKRQIIIQRGKEMSSSDMKIMRKRIIHEISKESSGYDIKHGCGGIKEIEFLIQYLQLKHAGRFPDLIIHNTVTAIKRLASYAILDRDTEGLLLHAHRFMRTIETLLRFNEEDVLKTDSEIIDIIIRFLNFKSKNNLMKQIEDIRQQVVEITKRFYGQNAHDT
jgi:glutamine synthetase adenylyltransferase